MKEDYRIGNWIMFVSLDKKIVTGKVWEVKQDVLVVIAGNGMHVSIPYPSVLPIEMDNRIFDLLGFTDNGSENTRYLSPLVLNKENSGWYMRQSNDYVNRRPIKYLHHLQNFFYDLTERELQINLQDF